MRRIFSIEVIDYIPINSYIKNFICVFCNAINLVKSIEEIFYTK